MKYLSLAAFALFALIILTPDANAVVCARGYRGAGCAGPHGAVGVRRRPVAHCYYRYGRRICRY